MSSTSSKDKSQKKRPQIKSSQKKAKAGKAHHKPRKQIHAHKKKQVIKKTAQIAAIIILCLLGIVAGMYIKRFDIAQLVISLPNIQNSINKEIRTAFMNEIAPRLRKEIRMTLLQKSGAFILRKRSEKQREKDAIKAVDRFILQQLKEKKLGVIVSRKLKQLDPNASKKYKRFLTNYFIAIVWRYDTLKFDVVAAFNLSFKDGVSIGKKEVNEKAQFFNRIAKVAEGAARGN
ncbi:MAG: hypothetical protein ACETWK_10410 [Candidatus Aminicenantaceae bacterium]